MRFGKNERAIACERQDGFDLGFFRKELGVLKRCPGAVLKAQQSFLIGFTDQGPMAYTQETPGSVAVYSDLFVLQLKDPFIGTEEYFLSHRYHIPYIGKILFVIGYQVI